MTGINKVWVNGGVLPGRDHCDYPLTILGLVMRKLRTDSKLGCMGVGWGRGWREEGRGGGLKRRGVAVCVQNHG